MLTAAPVPTADAQRPGRVTDRRPGGKIDYDVPAVLHDLLIKRGVATTAGGKKDGQRWGRVLDLGCGTGLNGPLYDKDSSVLVGVDISSKMVIETIYIARCLAFQWPRCSAASLLATR